MSIKARDFHQFNPIERGLEPIFRILMSTAIIWRDRTILQLNPNEI